MKLCLFCEKEFFPNKPKQKFCSDKCRVYFNREQVTEGGFIYCLRNPLKNNSIFYVGRTIISLPKRLSGHIRQSAKKSGTKENIIQSILKEGEEVIIEQLELITDGSISQIEKKLSEREKFWIKFTYENQDITNIISNPKNSRRNKTNPIGVRFEVDLFEKLREEYNIQTHQQMLNFLTNFFYEYHSLPITITKVIPKGKLILPQLPEKDISSSKPSSSIKMDKEAILKQIETIKAEQLPEQRNTTLGRKSWALEQNNRIAQLKKQLE